MPKTRVQRLQPTMADNSEDRLHALEDAFARLVNLPSDIQALTNQVAQIVHDRTDTSDEGRASHNQRRG